MNNILKHRTLFFYIVLFLATISCSKTTKVNDLNNRTLSIRELNKEKLQFSKLSNVVDSFFFIKLKNDEYISNIDKIRFSSDNMVIYDKSQQKIFVYDYRGNLISLINYRGKGNGEYFKITDFTINSEENQIIILDHFKMELLFYDFMANFLYSKKISTHLDFISFIGDNQYVGFNNYNPRLSKDRFNLFYLNGSGDIIDKAMPFEKNMIENRYKKEEYFFRSGGELFLSRLYDNNIYQIRGDSIFSKFTLRVENDKDLNKGIYNGSQDIKDLNPLIISNYYETKDVISVVYEYKETIENRFFVKASNDMIISSKSYVADDIFSMFWGNLVCGVYDDYFVICVNSDMVEKRFQSFKKAISSKYGLSKWSDILEDNPSLNELQNVSIDDNPFIYFVKIKAV